MVLLNPVDIIKSRFEDISISYFWGSGDSVNVFIENKGESYRTLVDFEECGCRRQTRSIKWSEPISFILLELSTLRSAHKRDCKQAQKIDIQLNGR